MLLMGNGATGAAFTAAQDEVGQLIAIHRPGLFTSGRAFCAH